MKLKNLLEKKLDIEFAVNKNFMATITKERFYNDFATSYKTIYHIGYYSIDINPFGDEFDYKITGIKLNGEETLTQAKKIIKDYFKQTKKVSNTKVIKSCYNEFNYDEYTMTMKSTKDFVSAIKKEFSLGNDFIYNEMGIYGLESCAMYLGY